MAGMFYSLKETAAKLGKTEREIKQLAKDGTLREFRDGTNLLFKIDEVEALVPKAEPQATEPEPQPQVEPVQQDEDLLAVSEEPSPTESVGAEELESLFALDEDQPSSSEQAPAGQVPLEPTEDLRLEESLQLDALQEPMPSEEGIDLSDTQHVAAAQADESAPGSSPEDDIFLAAETGAAPAEGEPSAMDTALTGEGVNVLGETDKEYKLTDDTLAETMAGLGASGEGSLEEIEKDVSLDSFGSGSGLLDLSLQADDTSLGGILDEIYTPEDQKAAGAEGEEGVGAADIAAETEQMPPAEDLAGAPLEQAMPAMVSIAAEPEPDASSDMLGGLLILSLIVLTYTIIAAASAGIFKTVPGLVSILQGMIWMVVAGLAVVTVGIAAVAFLKGSGGGTPKAPKPPKPPKEKKEKKKKDKKTKKETQE